MQFIYKVALVLVVVCVLIVLIAPEVDLPDSPPLRAYHGLHVVLSSIVLVSTLLLAVMMTISRIEKGKDIMSQFDSPSPSSLCTFLC